MGASSLGSRAIIGDFYLRLEQAIGAGWASRLAMRIDSDQEVEEYKWLGQAPAMREWIGGRSAKGLRENGISIRNKKFEATLQIPRDWIRRDKTGQIQIRVNDMADRAAAHPAKLLSALIAAGEAGLCYDGQYYFDTDHSEGASGTQSNLITVDISLLPVTNHGSTSAPSVGEMRECISLAIQQIVGFKDDTGEPMNEAATEFTVMVPTTLMSVAQAAVSLPFVDRGESNLLVNSGEFRIGIVPNARLNATWTTKFPVFRTDGSAKPLIHQVEEDLAIDAIAEGTEHEFKFDEWLFGIKKAENVGYGIWQHACLVSMT